jgi:hypothetical protein
VYAVCVAYRSSDLLWYPVEGRDTAACLVHRHSSSLLDWPAPTPVFTEKNVKHMRIKPLILAIYTFHFGCHRRSATIPTNGYRAAAIQPQKGSPGSTKSTAVHTTLVLEF